MVFVTFFEKKVTPKNFQTKVFIDLHFRSNIIHRKLSTLK